jgi:phage protein U
MSTYILLGSVRLDLITHLEGFSGDAKFQYAEHAIIERKEHLQWVGDNLETRNLACDLHSRFCDPQTEYEILLAAAKRHQALPLLWASGIYEGEYVIRGIQRVVLHTHPDGRPHWMRLDLELQEHVTAASAAGGVTLGELISTGLALATDPAAFATQTARLIGEDALAQAVRQPANGNLLT